MIKRKIDGNSLCQMSWPENNSLEVKIENFWLSEGYGLKQESEVIVFELITQLPFSFEYLIKKIPKRS